MAGLLDFNPAASPAQRMGTSGSGGVTLQDLLFGVGIGLLGNRNAAQGLAQGGLLAMQTGRQRQQDERQAAQDAFRERYMGAQMDQMERKAQAQRQAHERFQGLLSNAPEEIRGVLSALGPEDGARFYAERAFPKPTKAPAWEEKERALLEMGMSPAEARSVALGAMRVTVDPTTGQTSLVDLTRGTQRLLTPQGTGPQAAPQMAPSAQVSQAPGSGGIPSLPGLGGPSQAAQSAAGPVPLVDEVDRVYGLMNVAKDVGSGIGGQFNDRLVNDEVVKARTKARVLREDLISAFSKSGRPPVVEQARILENLPSLGIGESPGRARIMLETLADQIAQQADADESYAAQPGIHVKERAEAQARARDLRRIHRQIVGDGAREQPGGGQGGNLQNMSDQDLLRALGVQ